MSTLTNWVALNKQLDVLPEDTGRTLLNWIRSFESALDFLNLPGVMNDFQAHVTNYNNPHKVTIDQLLGSLTSVIWSYYASAIIPVLPEGAAVDETTFNAALVLNPELMIEIIRSGALNGFYAYQDMIGPRDSQPFYVIADLSRTTYPTPIYHATASYPDKTLSWNNTLSRTFSTTGMHGLTAFFGFKIISTSPNPAVWRIAFNDPAVAVTYVSSNRSMNITLDATKFNTVGENNVILPIDPSVMRNELELRGSITITPNTISLVYAVAGVLTKYTVNVTPLANPLSLTSYTVSHDFWDNQSDETATTRVSIHQALTDDVLLDTLMSVI